MSQVGSCLETPEPRIAPSPGGNVEKTTKHQLGCNQVTGRHTFRVRQGQLAPWDRCLCGQLSFRSTPEWRDRGKKTGKGKHR